MTRINVVNPSHLIDKALIAEYKEITRPFNKVIKRIEKHGVDHALHDVIIPDRYVLGTGHEAHFFDKLGWLNDRYGQLFTELFKRGINVNREKHYEIRDSFVNYLFKTPYWNHYTPTPEDFYLNMARLCRRSKLESVNNELNSDN